MTSIKLVQFVLVACVVFANAQFDALNSVVDKVVDTSKSLLDIMASKILLLEYNNVPTKEGYRFNYKTSDGSYREEVGMILNPGTKQEELVVMGAYGYTDKNNITTTTMYTSDSKNGYTTRVKIKNRGVSTKCLQSCVG